MERYRVGRHLGRTIYRIVPNDLNLTSEDELIGIMDTPELGALVVEALNSRERMIAAQGTSAQSPGKDQLAGPDPLHRASARRSEWT